ncbi:hypothetical protein NDU88_005010 [Pleurodeles waltl]|uniref:Uncharacterized protein n=1 Tax=Pleurodeles waltl TaxID=8319 RepID=A0AAV7SKK2_PLEWA|nr:hypothetical protein NDU88_005010 [Pleurodeles waltl]
MARTVASLSLEGERLRSAGSTSDVSGAALFPSTLGHSRQHARLLIRSAVHTGSGDVRVKAQHRAFSFRFSRSPGLSLSLPGLGCTACGNSSSFPHLAVSYTCSVPIAPDLRLHSGFPTVYLSGDGATSPRSWHARRSVAPRLGAHSNFGPRSQGGAPGRRLLAPVPLLASTLRRSRQHARLLVRSADPHRQRRCPC